MPIFIRLALLLDLTAIGVERVAPANLSFLPLGGDHFIQLGLLLLFGAIVTEAWSMVRAQVIGGLRSMSNTFVRIFRAIAERVRNR